MGSGPLDSFVEREVLPKLYRRRRRRHPHPLRHLRRLLLHRPHQDLRAYMMGRGILWRGRASGLRCSSCRGRCRSRAARGWDSGGGGITENSLPLYLPGADLPRRSARRSGRRRIRRRGWPGPRRLPSPRCPKSSRLGGSGLAPRPATRSPPWSRSSRCRGSTPPPSRLWAELWSCKGGWKEGGRERGEGEGEEKRKKKRG